MTLILFESKVGESCFVTSSVSMGAFKNFKVWFMFEMSIVAILPMTLVSSMVVERVSEAV